MCTKNVNININKVQSIYTFLITYIHLNSKNCDYNNYRLMRLVKASFRLKRMFILSKSCWASSFNKYFFWFQAAPLPMIMFNRPRMARTSQGDGLIMTYQKDVYTFKCESKTSCKWSKEPYSLQISRYFNLLLPVFAPFLDNCWWNKL